MGKKLGIKANIGSSSEANTLAKKGKKELGKDITDMPDAWDVKNIQTLIDTYEKAYPGRLGRMAQDYKVELALSGRSKDYGLISKDSDMRTAFWLPEDLQQVIEAAYPSLWTNKRHLAWFVKNFPIFRTAPKF